MSTASGPDRTWRRRDAAAATRVTLVGMVLDALLGVFKCVVGMVFHSQALVVDGIHSFSDVLSDTVVLGLMRASRRAPDWNHPYGHERFETIGTLLLGSFLIAIAGAVSWDSLHHLIAAPTDIVAPGWPVLVVALVSVLSKEWIYHYTRRVGLRIESDLIVANAWHSRTDALSSIVVLIGAAGAMAGYPWLDAVAAIVVGLVVAHIGWQLTWASLRELVDTALDGETTRTLYRLAGETEGVADVHALRSRRMGSGVLLDLHLRVNPRISVSEGHEIGVNVRERVKQAFPKIREVTFHIDAEDDSHGEPDRTPTPGRPSIEASLRRRWEPLLGDAHLHDLILHYLDHTVSVDVYISASDRLDRAVTTQRLQDASSDLPWLSDVSIWYDKPPISSGSAD
ncbi:cation diffusion facilitator family transporter [Tamilnaduibacter salinus]|uniref:Cation diffusion facilitator family transporter n=1 Tax=Tamilnaduibacter salinus TaxID=1484056 RepID=A0A2U1D030_9GAMM|nr:cation diffusion facilitator family transporter [Tamilnaduibacter salinus]PVY78398.1 cation diffusion facilitator family transporter [Tamilnaduibacter salinus]